MSSLQEIDPDIFAAIEHEKQRQTDGMELIPSENYVSPAVLEAMGSVLTNKYAEGYPSKRYYGGCEYIDDIESVAIERAKKLFRCDHANVQPHAGAPANIAAYFAWLEPGDTIMGMDLSHGGHLTHGHPMTYITKLFRFVRYKMKDIETGEIDYDEMRDIAKKNKPKIILAGFSAYPRELDYAKMKSIADEVGAIAMADVAHIAGMIAADVLRNPFDDGFQVVLTTTHKTLRGPRGGMIMSMGKVSSPTKKVEKTVENLPTLIDRSVFPGFQGGPLEHQIAAKAVAFGEALQPEFKTYAQQILDNAKVLADAMLENGFRLITGGTDNHLILIDITNKNITGKEAEKLLDSVGITLNKNPIADDPRPPFDPSGIRLGTPAITTRGMKEAEMKLIGDWINRTIENRSNESEIKKIKGEITDLCRQFPVPGISV